MVGDPRGHPVGEQGEAHDEEAPEAGAEAVLGVLLVVGGGSERLDGLKI